MRTPARFGLEFTAAPALRRLLITHGIDIVFAWGTQAAVAAGSARAGNCALVIERFAPNITDAEAKSIKSIAHQPKFAVACSSATVRRRMIEKGLPVPTCVVIRPGVDFAAINAARKDESLRQDLGLKPHERMVLASYPLTRTGGLDRIAWSGHLLNFIQPGSRMVLFGTSPECKRVQELSKTMSHPNANVWAGSNQRYENLIAISDCLVITPLGDVSTTPIAWAMAAGVSVIGSAVYAIAELIAHKHNGHLIKPQRGPNMTIRIAAALKQIDAMTKEKEVARGQAYQVFGVRRFADQHLQLYKNLTTGNDPGKDITDSAVET
ncbi:MAG: glycosyltransferase [Phycisphaerae bacterium]